MLKIKYHCSIKEFAYLKIGGQVKGYIETSSLPLIILLLKMKVKIKYVGASSNLLFAFNYDDCYYVKFINNHYQFNEKSLIFGSSITLLNAYYLCQKNLLANFAHLSVIPGTIGGSIINNASFQDETISSSLIKIKVLDEKGNIYYIPSSNIQFSFHQSSLKKQNLLIIEGEFMPLREEFENIKKQRIDALNYKIKSHPSYLDNLGSIFQNAYSQKVWKLIQSLNLHSYQLGQTRLSPLHYNFFDAYQESKVENVYYLIEEIRLLLYNKLGYDIDIEIEVLSAHGKK